MAEFWQWITWPPNALTVIAGVGVVALLAAVIWDEVNGG